MKRVPALANPMEILRTNVVQKRAEFHISQVALATKANVSRATVSKIEQGDGNVTVASLAKIAAVLHCRIEELFERHRVTRAGDQELARRAAAADDEFVDARSVVDAIDETLKQRRYSPAGRRRTTVGRSTASRRR